VESLGLVLSTPPTLPPGADVGLSWSGCLASRVEGVPLDEPFAVGWSGVESLFRIGPPFAIESLEESLLAGVRALIVLFPPLELEPFARSSACAGPGAELL
jgi:hypothetical protein